MIETERRICPYCETRPLTTYATHPRTCGHAECQKKNARVQEAKRRLRLNPTPKISTLCPYCKIRPLNSHVGRAARTCGSQDCMRAHQVAHYHVRRSGKIQPKITQPPLFCPICKTRPRLRRNSRLRMTCGTPDCVFALRNSHGPKHEDESQVSAIGWPAYVRYFDAEQDWGILRFATRSGECRHYAECLDIASERRWPSWACVRKSGDRCPRWIPENEVPVEIVAASAAAEWMESAGVVGRSVRLL